jgi:hypothetical protein
MVQLVPAPLGDVARRLLRSGRTPAEWQRIDRHRSLPPEVRAQVHIAVRRPPGHEVPARRIVLRPRRDVPFENGRQFLARPRRVRLGLVPGDVADRVVVASRREVSVRPAARARQTGRVVELRDRFGERQRPAVVAGEVVLPELGTPIAARGDEAREVAVADLVLVDEEVLDLHRRVGRAVVAAQATGGTGDEHHPGGRVGAQRLLDRQRVRGEPAVVELHRRE